MILQTFKVKLQNLPIIPIHIFDDSILSYSIKCSRQVFIKREISTDHELESYHVPTKLVYSSVANVLHAVNIV